MRFKDLKNLRVAILGTGREGHAVWRQLRKRYPDKTISLFSESAIDKGFEKKINPSVDQYHHGPLNVEHLKQFDVLVRSAGISPYRKELQQLQSLGSQFTTATNLWFAENPGANTICISGTMGKSTTAALTAHLLCAAGIKTCLAGNIGRPMLDCENLDIDWWVIELSSYQISDLEARPDIAVLLNLSEEHIDWHHGLERYWADKLKLARLATDGRLIANYSDQTLREKLKDHPDVIWFNKTGNWQAATDSVVLLPGDPIKPRRDEYEIPVITQDHIGAPASLPGEHNMQNLAAALTVVDTLGLEVPHLGGALASFSGLPHRQQVLGERAGVHYINDSISTTPVSVSAALQATGSQNVVLLLGGMDRGLDWSDFAGSLLGRPPYAIITLPDNGPKILDCLKNAKVTPEGGLHAVANLRKAVALAQTLVPENGCILLSPGAPSFPHFRDFEDRGNQFKQYAGFK
jgi:UDP-N-acetylmuramoylalanine--D-glutamate ligase